VTTKINNLQNSVNMQIKTVQTSMAELKEAVEDTVQSLAGELEGVPIASKHDPLNFDVIGDGFPGRPALATSEMGGTSFANSPALSIGAWIYVWNANNQVSNTVTFRRIHTQNNTIEIINSELPGTAPTQRQMTMFSHMSYNDGYIYLMSNSSLNHAFFYRYSIDNDSWEQLANFPLANGVGFQGGWIDNRLYGLGATTNPSAIYAYDSIANEWSGMLFDTRNVPQFGIFAVNNAALVHSGMLYMFGNSVQIARWNPNTNTLEMLAPCPEHPLVARAWTAPDGAIWIQQQGAAASASRLLRYDPIANTWLNFGLGLITTSACICPVGSWIYYVGQTAGNIQSRRLPSIEPPIITALPRYNTTLRLPTSDNDQAMHLAPIIDGAVGSLTTLRPFTKGGIA